MNISNLTSKSLFGGIKRNFKFDLASNKFYTGRLEFIDVAKSIGLLLVISSHCGAYWLMKPFALCFIAIFFICSGYTQIKDVSLIKRFKKLIIPYLGYNLLLVILSFITGKFYKLGIFGIFYGTYSLYTPLNVPGNLFFFNLDNGPTWFLLSLFVSSIWFSILSRLNGIKLVLCLLLYFALTCILHYTTNILLPWQLTTSFFFAILMYIGVLIRKRRLLENKNIVIQGNRIKIAQN